MSIEAVKAYLAERGRAADVRELDASSATVPLAALALGVEEARIAKSLSFYHEDGAVILVTAGDAKVDNKQFQHTFGHKGKMLAPEDTERMTGHAIGGVCPFAVPETAKVWLDVSLKRFDTIFPACGSSNSAIELTCEELADLSAAEGWLDLCKNWQEEEA